MGQALYRTYRSKSLNEIIGQEHITSTLAQALKTGKISHAYLFTGPRGVGKTSIARILAHEINDLPYTDDSSHMDIIEIDAASNRRIDEIRELREKVYVAPTSAKYKVYIIDEVHMLTREAFNALLKTLEEPPAHVIFILATTDAHKLPETIISRTQRFSFKPVEQRKVVAHLREIASAEHITIADDALELIAEHGEGSFRDSISMLDQVRSSNQDVTAHDVQQLLGIPSAEAITTLYEYVCQGATAAQLITTLHSLYQQGYQAAAIASQLAARLRQGIIDGTSNNSAKQLVLLKTLLEVPMSYQPERFLEVSLLETLPARTKSLPKVAAESVAPVIEPVVQQEIQRSVPEPKKIVEQRRITESEPVSHPVATAELSSGVLDAASWLQVLNELKKDYNTLYGIARMGEPDFSKPGVLELKFKFAFHQKRLKEAKNHEKLTSTIEKVTGARLRIECTIDPNATAAPAATALRPQPLPIQDSATLSAISNIFGGGELVE
jgi:DNA polymerase-3 subunit gamma/tau